MNEKRLRLLIALGALPMALVACGSATNGNNPGTGGAASGPPIGTAGGPVVGAGGAGQGTAGAGQGTAGGDVPLQTGPCVQGVPVTTQLPRLQNRQYANVVRDLLGVTAVDTTSVADALVADFSGAMTAPGDFTCAMA